MRASQALIKQAAFTFGCCDRAYIGSDSNNETTFPVVEKVRRRDTAFCSFPMAWVDKSRLSLTLFSHDRVMELGLESRIVYEKGIWMQMPRSLYL